MFWLQACPLAEKAIRHLEVELQAVVKHHVGSGNQIKVLWKSVLCSSALRDFNHPINIFPNQM